MMKQEMTANGLAIYSSWDFRTYEPQIVQNNRGEFEQITLCESYEGGRWEGFISVKNLGHFAKSVN